MIYTSALVHTESAGHKTEDAEMFTCGCTALPCLESRVLVIDTWPSAALDITQPEVRPCAPAFYTMAFARAESAGHKVEDAEMPIAQLRSLALC